MDNNGLDADADLTSDRAECQDAALDTDAIDFLSRKPGVSDAVEGRPVGDV
jgi:hypothetical protein